MSKLMEKCLYITKRDTSILFKITSHTTYSVQSSHISKFLILKFASITPGQKIEAGGMGVLAISGEQIEVEIPDQISSFFITHTVQFHVFVPFIIGFNFIEFQT